MNLSKFIAELTAITMQVENPKNISVEMADCIPVVSPVLKNGTVYITDEPNEKGA